jgi:cell division protein FtsB
MTNKQKRRLMLGMLVGVPIAAYILFSSRGLFARLSLEWERRTVMERVKAVTLEQDSLRNAIRNLETDTLLIERLARERYGMVKPGEQVFIINDPTTAAGAQQIEK